MPIYEFKCPHDGTKFELVRSMKDETPATCPECGKEAEKQISLSSFSLKGDGWARDLYGGKKK